MKIEDIKIEDTADANYVIKKFFNNDFKNIKMNQLEQLVLTVYSMGKNDGVSNDCVPDEIEPEPTSEVSAKANPFEINDRAKVLEDIEIGHSGIFMKTNNVGTVNSIDGNTVTVLFESVEDGELIEVNVSFDKLEKVS
ncbi:MAG: hypothetical protein LBC76_05340 [Treponema sp.]|jgi:hypothetical protein|nr:hypothetical protein [Treponema sp.]